MIDYLTEVKDLHDSGVSNADIAAHLNAKTANSMQAQASVYVLQDSGAVLIDPVTGQKFGTFISYYTSLPDGDSKNLIAFALDRWYSGEDVQTDQYPRSVQFTSVCESLPADLQAVCDSLVAEAGGRVHSGVTEADVAACIAEGQAEEQKALTIQEFWNRFNGKYNEIISPLIDGGTGIDDPEMVAGLQQIVDTWGV